MRPQDLADYQAFNRLHGFRSHPIKTKPGQRIAVWVISQFGEESTKVLVMDKELLFEVFNKVLT